MAEAVTLMAEAASDLKASVADIKKMITESPPHSSKKRSRGTRYDVHDSHLVYKCILKLLFSENSEDATVSDLSGQTEFGNTAAVASDQHAHQQASATSNLQSSESRSIETASGDIASYDATAGGGTTLNSIQESIVESVGTEGELTFDSAPVIENLP
jgi:hypothetical protein